LRAFCIPERVLQIAHFPWRAGIATKIKKGHAEKLRNKFDQICGIVLSFRKWVASKALRAKALRAFCMPGK
jgi:hypothetical protein